METAPRTVFITGGTGYLGSALATALQARGHAVRLLVRGGSEQRAAAGCEILVGDPLDAATYAARVAPADAFVHLVGTPKPSPWKARQFREIDLRSLVAAVDAASAARVPHFVYVSVAQPAPVMRAYVSVRAECERRIAKAGLVATILRPWYVTGPGHRWPLALSPVYRLLEAIPPARESAVRLGFVARAELVEAMVRSIESPPARTRILETAEIRAVSTPGPSSN